MSFGRVASWITRWGAGIADAYTGELVLSIQVDGAVDDLEVLAAGITEGLDQLIRLGAHDAAAARW
jgi:hypothetical protein